MKKRGLGGFFLVLAVTACSHQPPRASVASAPISEEATVTGLPPRVYPRALPVALPVTGAVVPTASVPDAAPSAPTPAVDAAIPVPAPGAVPASDTVAAPAPAPVQVVVLQTSFGRMVLEMDDFAAPKTCQNFRKLVADGFYNRTIFHRVIPNFMIQGGDPNTRTENRALYGQGDPGYTLPPEIKLHHDRGAVAMARLPDGVNPQHNSNGSQFYICVAACPSLDDQYTVFAHVIQGLDVADRIANVPRDNRDDPVERIAMEARLEPRDQALEEGSTIPGSLVAPISVGR